MMGRQNDGQGQLLYHFDLNELVPQDHLLRGIDRFFDFTELRDTPAYQQSRKDRKKVEMLFGHMKRILKLDRLRLRGLASARDEFLLAASAQNLRRLAQWLGQGPPDPGISVSA